VSVDELLAALSHTSRVRIECIKVAGHMSGSRHVAGSHSVLSRLRLGLGTGAQPVRVQALRHRDRVPAADNRSEDDCRRPQGTPRPLPGLGPSLRPHLTVLCDARQPPGAGATRAMDHRRRPAACPNSEDSPPGRKGWDAVMVGRCTGTPGPVEGHFNRIKMLKGRCSAARSRTCCASASCSLPEIVGVHSLCPT
jgi:hypothetical protein